MTQQAVGALRAEREALLDVLRSLSDVEWHAPSGCEGWRVQDVVTHMAASLHLVADPATATLPEDPSDMERSQEQPVRDRADATTAEALAYYEEMSARGIDALEAMQAPGLAELELDMGNLGRHPMHLLADAMVFDHWTHLRADILTPRGPIDRPAPASDELRMAPTVGWLLAGLPQMCTAELRPVLHHPFVLRLEGPGGGTWTVAPDGEDRAATVTEGVGGDVAGTVSSTTADFVVWSTKRRDWREVAELEGDTEYLGRVLDAVNLI